MRRVAACRRCLLVAVVLSAVTAGVATPPSAEATPPATHHVTKNVDDNSAGTLRYEIANAVGGDTVVIDAGVNPVLTQAHITVDKSLTLEGQSARTTIITRTGTTEYFFL